jgi:hypothetical protein
MPDTRASVESQSTITPISAGRRDGRRLATSIASAAERDLLNYMGTLLLELEEIAVGAEMEGLADLLAYACREVERNRKRLT